jgi:hypothetical protein
MPLAEVRIQKLGGGTFIVAGVLLLAANLLVDLLPTPPTAQGDFSRWITANSLRIALANELLFFATILLVPSFVVLAKLLGARSRVSAFAGLSIVAMALPLLAVLNVIEGRLVYPVYGLALSADAFKLTFGLFYGGLHAVLLMFGAALLLFGFALRGTVFNKTVVPISCLTGLLQIAGAYPWLTSVALNVFVSISLSLWMVLIGIMVLRMKPGAAHSKLAL